MKNNMLKIINPKATFKERKGNTIMSLEFNSYNNDGNKITVKIPNIILNTLKLNHNNILEQSLIYGNSTKEKLVPEKRYTTMCIDVECDNDGVYAYYQVKNDIREMTIKEIEDELGYKIKIVNN